MARIPGTTFSDHTPKVDWEKKCNDKLKENSSLQVENAALRAIIDGLVSARQAFGESKFGVALSEICEELDLDPFGTKCKCNAEPIYLYPERK